MHSAYQQLCQCFSRLNKLSHLRAIAGWDMQTKMPIGGSKARGEALAELDVIQHEQLTDPRIAELLSEAEQSSLSEIEEINLYEMRRQYQQAAVLPADLVEAKALAASRCEHAWREQRPANDWQGFAKNFTSVVELSRQEAAIRSEMLGISSYDALLDLYEPGMTSAKLDKLFAELKLWLPGLLEQVVAQQSLTTLPNLTANYPIEKQQQLALTIMQQLGFNFQHGRLDISAHPFCGGVPQDVRITTRYNPNEFMTALMGVIHETGHARYEQNLPAQWAGQPIARARSMGIHESQSLMMEMQLGRSAEFLNLLFPIVKQNLTLPDGIDSAAFISIAQKVEPGLIRVDADEVSYPAHVILRYEIERDLIEGAIEICHIPDLWAEKMACYLNLDTQGNYRDGCLQDIHWTDGSFGYFPSYTLGAMYAAQMFQAAKTQIPQLLTAIKAGDFNHLFTWLQQHIWQHGSRYSVDSLLTQATGEGLNPQYFRHHLEQRYLSR